MVVEPIVETTSQKTASNRYKTNWLRFRPSRCIDKDSVWMFVDGSSTGWYAAVVIDPFKNTVTKLAAFQEPASRNIGPELRSLLHGLSFADPTRSLVVVHDYLGTGAWLAGAWQIKSQNVLDIVSDIRRLIDSRAFKSVRFIHHAGHQKDDSDFTRWNCVVDNLCTNKTEITDVSEWIV